MIKATATSGVGEKLVILGLSEVNVQNLKDGKPLVVEMWELGYTGKLVIMYGETEDKIAEQFRANIEIGEEVDERKPGEGH
jgi:hypothetical protein